MSLICSHATFCPSRGGHAPGHIRDAFLEAIEAYADWEAGHPEPVVHLGWTTLSISRICGLVWNCRDILPGMACRELADLDVWSDKRQVFPEGSTYARGARALLELIKDNLPTAA
jgi:hypothetical protein